MEYKQIVLMASNEQLCETATCFLHKIGFSQISSFAEVTPFLTYISQLHDAIILLVYEGPFGVELAWNVRERSPDSPLIWFSDLDFAITAYRLHVNLFNLFPVTEEALRKGLEHACWHKSNVREIRIY